MLKYYDNELEKAPMHGYMATTIERQIM